MSILSSASQRITRVALVPAPGRSTLGRRIGIALALSILGLGTALWRHGDALPSAASPGPHPSQQAPAPLDALQQRVTRAELALSLAETRGHELERQIDALNQRLREAQDELTFFRKAGERKH
jgi:hypothetical protein